MEEDLEAAYQSYCQRQGHRAEKERQKRRRLGMDGELGSDEEEAAKAAAEYEPGSPHCACTPCLQPKRWAAMGKEL